jgi:ribose transport system ATP-binding protein
MSQVELRNICKSFGGISALKDVTFKVEPGEIHAVVGENGAGKSTLMKILSGAHSKDSGKIFVDNNEVNIKTTHDSKRLGISIIYQEFSLIPDLSVAENIFFSKLRDEGLWMNWKRMKRDVESLMNEIGFRINPSLKVGELSIAHQQIVEIAKALSEKAHVLILDEPSAVLGPHEIKKLFDTLNRLKNEGVSIIYISHHLNEIFQLADRVTVLKDGNSGGSLKVSETNKVQIIKMMLGRSLHTMFPGRDSKIGEEIIRTKGIHVADKVNGVSLSARAGEVLGIAGLVGSGRTETVRAIFGADRKTEGTTFLFGRPLRIRSPHSAVRKGIGMVPEDRKQQGVILSLSIQQNISLPNFHKITNKLGFIKTNKARDEAKELIGKLSIKTPSEKTAVATLSGGNQQKVSLAKWIGRNSKVMIIDEPTRGVDVGAKVEIYKLINELSRQGMAVIVVSSETEELIGICDRILVMRKGQIQGELEKKDFSEENILRLSIGT